MTLSDILIAEFDQEAATTRRVLELYPNPKCPGSRTPSR